MPVIDVSYPKSTFTVNDKQKIAMWFSDKVINWEGWSDDNTTKKADTIAWSTFNEHNQDDIFVGGEPTNRKLIRVSITTPAGAVSDKLKKIIIEEVDELIMSLLSNGDAIECQDRVWVTFIDLREGDWGSEGKIVTLDNLIQLISGNAG